MSECKRNNCEEEAACSYNNDYCSSTCEIMQLRAENKGLREAICVHVREHMDTSGIDNDNEAVIYFKNTFNENNYR